MTPAAPEASATPRATYDRRLADRSKLVAALAARDRNFSRARLAVFLIGAGMCGLVFTANRLAFAWLLAPLAVFVALLVAHDRVIQRRQWAERAKHFYSRGLARLDHRFAGLGKPGDRFLELSHPYAADLDLFGKGSLFETLSDGCHELGEEALAAWLLAPASPAEVCLRQQAVRELTPRLDLREETALLGDEVHARLEAKALIAWGEAPPLPSLGRLRVVAALLPALSIAALAAWPVLGIGPLPFLVVAILGVAFEARIGSALADVDRPLRSLTVLADLLLIIEREDLHAERLATLRTALRVAGEPPSRRIQRLTRRVDLLDAWRNQLFAPIAFLLLWRTQFGLAIEAWRAAHARALRGWLEAAGDFEALLALASHAFEHPEDPFPEVVEGPALYEGVGLGHPLLAEPPSVRNDVRLGTEPALLLVSGSNMSGKSTLLRTVGSNAVLAFAGAPVRARSLRLTPLALGASIRLHDSLQEGTSRFYAEIQRIAQIVALTRGPIPVLFLLDEVLHGTNSHDRRIGAAAIVKGLLARGAMGLVTTHDLALAEVAVGLGARGNNVHFADHVEAGRVSFDYHMRPGVVTKSNALELMRSVGLEV